MFSFLWLRQAGSCRHEPSAAASGARRADEEAIHNRCTALMEGTVTPIAPAPPTQRAVPDTTAKPLAPTQGAVPQHHLTSGQVHTSRTIPCSGSPARAAQHIHAAFRHPHARHARERRPHERNSVSAHIHTVKAQLLDLQNLRSFSISVHIYKQRRHDLSMTPKLSSSLCTEPARF